MRQDKEKRKDARQRERGEDAGQREEKMQDGEDGEDGKKGAKGEDGENGEKCRREKKKRSKRAKNIPFRVQYKLFFLYLHPKGYNYFKRLPFKKFTTMDMSLSSFVKERRKQLNLTQTDLAEKSGVGLRFVRELEQGKQTLRMDKINQVLALFGHEVGAVPAASLRQ